MYIISYQCHPEISTDVIQRDVTPSTLTVRSDCDADKANTDLTKQKKKNDGLLKSSEMLQDKKIKSDDCGREMSLKNPIR